VTPLDGTGLIDASGNITFGNLGSNKIIQTIQIPVSSATMMDDGGHQLQLQVKALPTMSVLHATIFVVFCRLVGSLAYYYFQTVKFHND
jgi:hypothetical protein